MKFYVELSEDLEVRKAISELLQKTAFENGYKWLSEATSPQHLDEKVLQFNGLKRICRPWSDECAEGKLLTIEQALKELRKPEFKVGGWVIGWHADYKTYRTKAWKIKEVLANGALSPKRGYATTSKNVSHATQEEIKQAEVFKIGGYEVGIGRAEVTVGDRVFTTKQIRRLHHLLDLAGVHEVTTKDCSGQEIKITFDEITQLRERLKCKLT